MIFQPIIPVWLAALLCIGMIVFRIRQKWGRWLQLGISILLFLINLRPMQPGESVELQESNLDVIMVIDQTLSMYALDYGNEQEERMEGVRQACLDITEKLAGSRFAVITFSNWSQIAIPFTKDLDMVRNFVGTMKQMDYFYAKGSDLAQPKEQMEYLLQNSRECEQERKTVVIYISDGENNSGYKIKSFGNLEKYIDAGLVLGFGTSTGGYMRERNQYDENDHDNDNGYVWDYSTYENAVSKIDEANLKQIGNDMGLTYIHYTQAGCCDQELENIQKMSEPASVLTGEGSKDLYFYLLYPLAVLLLIDWFVTEKKKVMM